MNRQGNIISFDDARRLASAQSAYAGDAYISRSSAAFPAYVNTAPDFYEDAIEPQDSLRPSPHPRSSRALRSSASRRDVRYSFSTQDFSQMSVRPAVEVYDDELSNMQEDLHAFQRGKKGKRRAKAKAEKMFVKQFGDDDASGGTGSRAAVYKGEMGRSHKRAFDEVSASRRNSSAVSVTSRKPKKLRSSTASRIAVTLGCLVCVMAVLLFLYPTAQQVYLESREKDRLQAVYDALVERNTALQERIDYLSTDEGIEDTARKELGWVQEGEIAVVVEGLSEDSEGETASVTAQITSDSVATPDTWYSPILDIVFGYTDSTTVDDDASSSDVSSDDSSSDE